MPPKYPQKPLDTLEPDQFFKYVGEQRIYRFLSMDVSASGVPTIHLMEYGRTRTEGVRAERQRAIRASDRLVNVIPDPRPPTIIEREAKKRQRGEA
jgi:hypothetical protein